MNKNFLYYTTYEAGWEIRNRLNNTVRGWWGLRYQWVDSYWGQCHNSIKRKIRKYE